MVTPHVGDQSRDREGRSGLRVRLPVLRVDVQGVKDRKVGEGGPRDHESDEFEQRLYCAKTL